MSIQSQINRITGAKNDLATYLDDNGVSVPAGTKIDGMVALLDSVQKGIDTSDADATANDIAQGKTAYVDGQKVTGNIYVFDKVQSLYDTVPTWDAENQNLMTHFFVTNARAILEPSVTINIGVDATKLGDATDADVAEGKTYTSQNGLKRTGTKQAPVPVTQATPTITVDETTGLITAKSTQGAGLVSAGTKQATKQLPVLDIQAYMPGTEMQVIEAGQYLIGNQYIPGSENLLPENIKYGISIFGVTGTFAGGGLPDGVSAIASGTVTPAEDSTSGLVVTHNLGVVPNFCVWYVEDDYSGTVATNAAIAGAIINKKGKYTESSSITYNVHYMIAGYGSSSQQTTTSGRVSNTTYMTTTNARLVCTSSYSIKAGKRIRWVAGVASGVL